MFFSASLWFWCVLQMRTFETCSMCMYCRQAMDIKHVIHLAGHQDTSISLCIWSFYIKPTHTHTHLSGLLILVIFLWSLILQLQLFHITANKISICFTKQSQSAQPRKILLSFKAKIINCEKSVTFLLKQACRSFFHW